MTLIHEINKSDLLVVGCGLFGMTIAERVANVLNKKVIIIEKRNHIGGNAFSYFDSGSGIEVHKYGSHLFHTSNSKIWKYVNNFTKFNDYKHKVFSISQNKIYSLPVNLLTFSQIYGQSLSPIQAREIIEKETLNQSSKMDNLEHKALSLVGNEIYYKLIRGYTQKQWNKDPKLLPAEIISRLPIRYNYDNRYFDDSFEGLPLKGYTSWFQNILNSANIKIFLETDFFLLKDQVQIPVIYTGPIDRYFNYSSGVLSWRTLDFEFEFLEIEDFQGTSVINYADTSVPYTRIHEFKHLHPERAKSKKTIIAKEFSRAATDVDEPFYPVNSTDDRRILQNYREKVARERKNNVFFGGRLGTYKYLDMHMAIGSALNLFENQITKLFDSLQ